MIERMGYSVKHGTWLESPVGVESLYNMIWSFSNEPVVAVACIILLVFGLVSGILRKPSESLSMRALVLFWFVIPFFGMFVVSYKVPMYISRYLIFALPGYYILLGLCIESLIRTDRFRNIAFVFLVLSFAFTLNLNPDKKQYIREAVSLINKKKSDASLILISPFDVLPSFAYNYNVSHFKAISDNKEYEETIKLLRRENIYFINNEEPITDLLHKQFDHVIYLRTEGDNESSQRIKSVLSENYIQISEHRMDDNYTIFEYRKK
jgi:hypothetical protein